MPHLQCSVPSPPISSSSFLLKKTKKFYFIFETHLHVYCLLLHMILPIALFFFCSFSFEKRLWLDLIPFTIRLFSFVLDIEPHTAPFNVLCYDYVCHFAFPTSDSGARWFFYLKKDRCMILFKSMFILIMCAILHFQPNPKYVTLRLGIWWFFFLKKRWCARLFLLVRSFHFDYVGHFSFTT